MSGLWMKWQESALIYVAVPEGVVSCSGSLMSLAGAVCGTARVEGEIGFIFFVSH